jgi:class III poly(R)-hydroxyalkanoic acid synthase PhaE subunit
MASDDNAAGEWAAAMQKAQADLIRQWTELGQAAMRAGAPAAAPASAPGAPAEALARQFMQQCEQYLGVSRSLWDLLSRAATVTDTEQRARLFADGVGSLQQQFAQLWVTGTLGSAGTAGLGWPGASSFGAGAPGLGAFAGLGAYPGAASWPGMAGFPGSNAAFGMPALGPAREQQESLQRLGQVGMRYAQAQLQVSAQWNEIIGRALRELGERLAPRLKTGALPGSMKEVYDLWVDSAESVYAQAARGGGFVQAQAELTNAGSLLRTAQREWLEEWARQFDLPTRSELNSIHQQLRDLKAALAASRG